MLGEREGARQGGPPDRKGRFFCLPPRLPPSISASPTPCHLVTPEQPLVQPHTAFPLSFSVPGGPPLTQKGIPSPSSVPAQRPGVGMGGQPQSLSQLSAGSWKCRGWLCRENGLGLAHLGKAERWVPGTPSGPFLASSMPQRESQAVEGKPPGPLVSQQWQPASPSAPGQRLP